MLKIPKRLFIVICYLLNLIFLVTGWLTIDVPLAFAISPPFPAINWLHQEASTVIPTNSWQLMDSDVDQGENTSTSVKPKSSATEIQWWPGVANRTSGGLTDGYGWIFDSPLNGKYDAVAGNEDPDQSTDNWTFYVRLRLTAGNAPTGNVRAYVKRYDGSSTYTNLFTATSGSITPSGTATTYSFSYDLTSDLDMQGQYLYVHYTWQSSSGGNNPTAISFQVEGTGLAAADRARIVTGSSSVPSLGSLLTFSGIAFFLIWALKRGILRFKEPTRPLKSPKGKAKNPLLPP